jgi:dCMP deaminase
VVKRLSKWDQRQLFNAKLHATFSKDPSTCIGAVITRPDKTEAGHGFNGMPRGVDDEHMNDRPFKYASVIHAEDNATINSGDSRMNGYTMYVWGLACCGPCTSKAIQKGITRIVCVQEKDRPDWEESFEVSRTLVREAGVSIEVWHLNELPESLLVEIPRFDCEWTYGKDKTERDGE